MVEIQVNKDTNKPTSTQNQIKNHLDLVPTSHLICGQNVSLTKVLTDCFENSEMLHLYIWLLQQVTF